MFVLFNVLAAIFATLLDQLLHTNVTGLAYGLFYFVYALVAFLPGLAVTVRRLHDVGKSGWMLLLVFIPLVGAVWLMVLLCSDSESGENEYGPNPKDPASGVDTHMIDSPMSAAYPMAETNTSDHLVTIALVWMFVSSAFWSILQEMQTSFYDSAWFKPVSLFSMLVWSFIPIMLSLAIKKQSLRTLCLVLGVLQLLYGLYGIYDRM